jgi:uncharacterized protein YbjT (DUF2867 family)
MKLAVVGASGRTGLAVMRAALERGIQVFPVLRDDRELGPVAGMVPAGQERFADFGSSDAMVAALHGCSHAIVAIQPRCTGPGFPVYGAEHARAIVQAAERAGLDKILWCSTQACYHWSKHDPSRQGYDTEFAVQNSAGPWAIAKISAYHDEIFDAYVAPPDGGRPLPVPRNGHWAPMSRADAGRLLLACLERVPFGRAQCIGGPELLMAARLRALVERRARTGRGRPTACLGLPDGDQAVMLEDTLTTAGMLASERLGSWLDAQLLGAPEAAPTRTVYPSHGPASSALDDGAELPLWESTGPVLRRVIHELLGADLRARGLEPARLDFSEATTRAPRVEVHGGTLATMRGVRALDAQGRELHAGEVNWLWDPLAEELRVFYGRKIPEAVWDELDPGVRRRLVDNPRYAGDKRVRAFGARA